MSAVRNEPSPEGRALGKELARLADKAEKEIRPKLPADFPERCRSCAFRPGTFPNGCLETVMDALKCTMEGRMFFCHHPKPDANNRFSKPCTGYLVSRAALRGTLPLNVPWKFSHEHAVTNTPPINPQQ